MIPSTTITAPALRPTLRRDIAGKGSQRFLDRRLDRIGHRNGIGDQDRLCEGIMLGLGKKIPGDPFGISAGIGDHDQFGGAGNRIDSRLAERNSLGRCHEGVARTDDDVRTRNCLRATSEGSNRLGSANPADQVAFRLASSGKDQRIDGSIGSRRRCEGHVSHTGNSCRNYTHQDGGRVAGTTARRIDPCGLDRAPTPSQANSGFVLPFPVPGKLPLVIGPDAPCRGRQGGALFRSRSSGAGLDLVRRERNSADMPRVETIKAERVPGKCVVTAIPHALEYFAGDRIDRSSVLCLQFHEAPKGGAKSGLRRVKPQCQRATRPADAAVVRPPSTAAKHPSARRRCTRDRR